jgi:hypothetical protein
MIYYPSHKRPEIVPALSKMNAIHEVVNDAQNEIPKKRL